MVPDSIQLVSLKEINCHEDIPETHPTIAGNAIQKAAYIKEHYGLDCFAEDTGLEVEALDNAPGVLTARYAGPQKDADDNMDLLLLNLEQQSNRNARFKTVIALIWQGETYTFEGIAPGQIAKTRQGSEGFGYDPIFIPQNYERSFAQMTLEEKQKISHRGIATRQLIQFFQERI